VLAVIHVFDNVTS